MEWRIERWKRSEGWYWESSVKGRDKKNSLKNLYFVSKYMFPIDLLTHSQLEKTGVVQKWITWIKTSWYKVFVPFNSLCIFHSLLIITWLIFLIMIIVNIVPSLHTKFCQFSRSMYFCLLKTSKFWNILIFAILVGRSVVFLSLIYRKLSHDITNFHKNYCMMWRKRLILCTAQEI